MTQIEALEVLDGARDHIQDEAFYSFYPVSNQAFKDALFLIRLLILEVRNGQ